MNGGQSQKDKLRVASLRKTYGNVIALNNIDLNVREGEFLTLLGPSGSGKSTLLWTVAGLTLPDSGTLWIDGKDATRVPANERGLGMVFQNYALFPHLTVSENVAFPLKMRREGKQNIIDAVKRTLDIVKLAHLADRLPSALSGGQQQRIALARAMVYEPSVILMDEPLGALDKKLRDHLQFEIKELHERLGITVLYVTHDQEEAMVMSDRICLMNLAKIEQIGTPLELYNSPKTLFAADFLGESNILEVILDQNSPGRGVLASGEPILFRTPSNVAIGGQKGSVMIRPDAIRFVVDQCDHQEEENRAIATVRDIVMAGALTKIFLRMVDGAELQANVLTSGQTSELCRGAEVTVAWRREAVAFLPENTGG